MLPFRSNVKIFIIEFICTLLLQTIYGITIYGWEKGSIVLLGMLPALFMALIGLKVQNEDAVIRCLYLAAAITFYIMSMVLEGQETLPFMFLAVAVTLALFLRPRILTEYMIISMIMLIGLGILTGHISVSDLNISLYVTYVMLYAFAFVALLFIIIGVERYKKEMEEKNELARDALEAKSNFLANMSHEIRTPMNAIYGMAELLERDNFGREGNEYIATIKNSSENLLSIINEILDFSKLDSGMMKIENAPYDINNMLNDVISIIRFRLREKNVVLKTEIDRTIPTVLIGDEIRIRQILINLLNNAVKFTNRGTITLKMDWETHGQGEGLLRIRVIDTGIGISQENVEKLFIAFGQLDTKKNRNVEGTGLGLAICKQITDLLGGTIGVSSVLKQGSTFFVNIPQKVQDPSPCGFDVSYEEPQTYTEMQQVSFVAPKAKVLIVDDNKVNLQVAKELMKLFGFEAATAESGQDAIDRIDKQLVKFDMIFMDHMMPFMDGVEATAQIRLLGTDYARNIPIVALTANAIKGVEQQFMDAGMNDYLPKPIRLDQLTDVLARWIPKSKQYPYGTTMEQITEQERNIDFSKMPREEILEWLEGIDVKTGIKNCAGSIDVYFDLLQTYAASNLANALNIYYENEDLENYSITAHSIKGASKNIGAHDVADKAYSLERAGKRGDINYIWDYHQELVDDYLGIIRMLKKIFFGNVG